MSLRSFRSAYLETVLELLWRQWTTLGVLGQREYSGSWPIDPEGLIVSTIRFGRYEPRLFDGAIEWWATNGEWLSSTRLRKLQTNLSQVERRALAAVAEVILLKQKPQRWKRLVTENRDDLALEKPRSLFLLHDGKPLPRVGVPDPIFLRVGLLRPKFETRRIAQHIPLDRPGNLRIRFRGLFGVSSRAEITLYLLTHNFAHARLMARQTYYAQASVSTALKQMALSGLVFVRHIGREVEYQIDRLNWQKFFKLPNAVAWTNWVLVFGALHEIWECLENVSDRKVTKSILGSELRRCARRTNEVLRDSELEFAFSEGEAGGLEQYHEIFAKDLKTLFETLDLEFDAVPFGYPPGSQAVR